MQKEYEIDTKEGIRRFYDEHIEFAEYVTRFANGMHMTVDEALKQAVVRERAKDYIQRGI